MNCRYGLSLPVLMVAAMTLSGCSLRPQRQPVAPVHDLGPLPAAQAQPGTHAVLVVQVNSPAWLNSTAILYREQFADPTELHPYANGRWAASPAELLEERVKSTLTINGDRLAAFSGRDLHYRLAITLESFEQSFQQPRQAQVLLRLRALLIEPTTRRVIDQHVLVLNKPCAPDMNGAIEGLSSLANTGTQELVDWLAAIPPAQIQITTPAGSAPPVDWRG